MDYYAGSEVNRGVKCFFCCSRISQRRSSSKTVIDKFIKTIQNFYDIFYLIFIKNNIYIN